MTRPLSRRTLLKGAGVTIALPFLEAMLPAGALAAEAVKKQPQRLAFVFVPNGAHMPAWTPSTTGAGFDLPSILDPLAQFKSSLNVLTGLTQYNANALGDGGGDHARSAAAWLTGCHCKKTDGADIRAGVSVDQIAAQHVGSSTMLPSLEIGCTPGGQNGNCDSGYSCAYTSNIAWQSPDAPLAKEINPRLVFQRLFGTADAPAQSPAARERRTQDDESILDSVMSDAHSLQAKLGSRDRGKLDEYLTGVREVEQRISSFERARNSAGVKNYPEPAGIPTDFGEHMRLMADMMHMAFRADLTRVCTFMVANDGNNRSYPEAGVPEGHHDMSHHGGDPVKQDKIRRINRFHMEQFAYLLGKLQATEEAGGSLLDNCMIVYGAGISDGNAHNHDNLPILLAGRGGGTIRSGRHVVYTDGTPMTNLFLCLLDRLGIGEDKVGDSSGRLQQLV
ncbi:MAG: DUF1552 domain-containing protein [Armatimonadetes bacterium]|nr:DUF1552 domain-containing protein [Armatimonadota bacterium]MDE2207650.1 DUF1552 domain-containing protein [Armatimonadota bacterium]